MAVAVVDNPSPQPSLFGRARGIARAGWEAVANGWAPIRGPFTSILVSDSDAGPRWMPVTEQTAMAVTAVYAAVRTYVDLIGTLPIQRLRDSDDARLPPPPFVTAPDGLPTGWTDEVGQIVWSLLLRGNAYLLPTSLDWTDHPATFYVAAPDTVSVERAPTGGARYRLRRPDGSELVIDDPEPSELLHIRWQRPPGAWCGLGVLDAAGGPLGPIAGAWWTDRYATDTMANPTPPAVLQHPLRLNPTQAAQLQTQWAESLGRAKSVPAVLSGGITYQPLTVSPRDVELIASRKWNATQIAVLFGLPPYLLGGSTGDSLTYSTVEGENTRLWTQALAPMCIRLERPIGGAWLPNGQRLRFVPDAILRSQTTDRYNAHHIALDPAAPFMTQDEVRALENLPPMTAAQKAATAPPPPPTPPPSSANSDTGGTDAGT